MEKRVIVLSLGGSLIIPEDINLKVLKEFKKVILKNSNKFKFIVVCGGGSIARKYISALQEIKCDETKQSYIGIACTRTNARFMSYFFGQDREQGIPHTTKTLEEEIKKSKVVFCGALEYKPKQTSDSTAAQIANHFNTIFINLTNVQGLHDKNPLEHKDAKFIPKISWEDFDKMANKKAFKPGQHFVLDQSASKIILKHKIPTYILGQNMSQLDRLLNNKEYKGTLISG